MQSKVTPGRAIAIMLCAFACLLAALPALSQTVPNHIVISQVYGGGGATTGSPSFKNDYVELFNPTATAVTVTGWSVQYASSGGSSWSVSSLTGTIQPGQYFLVQEGGGSVGGTLPAADSTGGLNMAAGTGKVALVSTATALSGTCPARADLVDLIGYGAASCSETAVAPALTNILADTRAFAGCSDTDNNSADFSALTPSPRNSSSPLNNCGATPVPTNPAVTGSATPSLVAAGTSTLLKAAVTAGLNPASTGLTVRGDLTAIGGSATQQFFDDGTHGDAVAADGIYSFQFTVPAATSTGAKSLPLSVNDAEARSGSGSISLTVTPSSTSPTGTGNAAPGTLLPPGTVLLTVNVTSGANPVSSGITVVADLSSIGGSSSQQLYDDGTHGDAASGDSVFTYQASIDAGVTPGAKSLAVQIGDAEGRSGSANISLTIQAPPKPKTVKISQVYGGGGNSGATYTNDFIELFNVGTVPVDVSQWSVQYNSGGTSATGTWFTTPLCPAGATTPCIIQPKHYFLVKEAQGSSGTTALPDADVAGSIAMGAGNGKIALVGNATALSGDCPNSDVLDEVGYGNASCFETKAVAALANTTAAVRKDNGCLDSDNNFTDFQVAVPTPRNSASPAQSCGEDHTQPYGQGHADPAGIEPASSLLLTVQVVPATTPPSTGITVSADLSGMGGQANEPFYDDGTHGDTVAHDGTYTYFATVPLSTPTGVKTVVATVNDAEGRSAIAPIAFSVISPTCGVERWSVKVGTDPDAGNVMLANPVRTSIQSLINLPAPPDPPGPPDNARLAPTELGVYVINATATVYKKEADVDYHIVIQDEDGRTMVVEIPSPACILTPGSPRTLVNGPFTAGVAAARANFDAHFTATPFFQTANVPVQVKGVAFFDFIHGQTGVAPDGIELHPLLEINFTANSTNTLVSSANPSSYAQAYNITATISNGGSSTPTGDVSFFDSGVPVGTATLDGNGQAVLPVTTASVGFHTYTASYEGDSTTAPSKSQPLIQEVKMADQSITFAALANRTWGDPDFTVSATASSGLPVTFAASGVCTITGSTVTWASTGGCTITASQAGDGNYNPAADVAQSFTIEKANQTITFGPLSNKTLGDADFNVSATASTGFTVSFSATGSCSVSGTTVHILTVGVCTVTASQAGDGNYNAAPSVAQSFTVGYVFGGFASPLADGRSAQPGSTVPVKFQLSDGHGNPITTTSAVTGVVAGPCGGALAAAQAAGGSQLRFDSSSMQFVFNWKTSGAPGCYQIGVTLLDTSTHTASIYLK